MLTTGPDKFYWDMELLQDSPNPDEPLDEIIKFNAHQLRFIDWIEDEDIFDKIKLGDNQKGTVLNLLDILNSKRSEVLP